MARSRALIWRYYLFRTTNSAGFYVPVAVLLLRDSGFGLGFVGVAYAVFGAATLAAEIPTGYLGDLLGRRRSLALGAGVRALVLAAYPFAGTAAAVLALHVLWATARTFRSGTQDAWLYELLAARFDEDEFARVESRGSAALFLTSAGGALAGGALYTVHHALPFLVTAALAALGVPLLLTFPRVEPADGTGRERRDSGDRFTVGDALRVLGLQARRPAVRWLVCYAALFHAAFLVTRVYEQPALRAVGVPVTGLGALYAGFKLLSAGAASAVGWLEKRLGARGVFGLLAPVYALAYASLLVAPALVVPVLFLNRGLRTVTKPVRNQYLNDRLAGVGRATVLSGSSMVLAAAGAAARLVASWRATALGPVRLLPWVVVPVAVAAGVLWVAVSPVREKAGVAVGRGPGAPAD